MKINVPLPFDHVDPPGEFTTMEAVAEVGAAAERAGFHAGLVTDHPCPTGRWLDSGGHYAQGPFVMLAMLAARTGAALLAVHSHFVGDGWGHDISAPIELPGERLREQVSAGTQAMADLFAAGIRRYPADWHMLQRLWLADLSPRDPRTG